MTNNVGILTFFAENDLEGQITSLGVRTVLAASLALIVLTILAAVLKNRAPKLKLPLFLTMAITVIGTTVLLFASTVYLNMKSESGGPVHWHSGIEFWACGAELNLRDPHGLLSNKIGTSTYHEHDDKFIHLEGVVVRKAHDASLEKFMSVTGGYINENGIGIPLNDGGEGWFAEGDMTDGDIQRPENYSLATGGGEWITPSEDGPVLNLRNGRGCGGDSEPAEVQAFVYRFNEESDTYVQEKLDNPADYVMREESILGPPSDCVIIEYNTRRETTDKLCEQYGVKDAARCTEFGVKEYDPELCNIREVGREL